MLFGVAVLPLRLSKNGETTKSMAHEVRMLTPINGFEILSQRSSETMSFVKDCVDEVRSMISSVPVTTRIEQLRTELKNGCVDVATHTGAL